MIRVWIEIRGIAAGFRLEVRAQSIEQAVRLAGVRYPGREVRVLFPIDPQNFFCGDPILASDITWVEAPPGQARDRSPFRELA